MARTETVEFTNMCMICDGSRVVVIDQTGLAGHHLPRMSYRAGRILYGCRDS